MSCPGGSWTQLILSFSHVAHRWYSLATQFTSSCLWKKIILNSHPGFLYTYYDQVAIWKKAQNFGKWLCQNVNRKLIIKANLHPFSVKEGVSGRKVELLVAKLQVFRKYLLKITTHEMTSWGCYPVLHSHLSFQRAQSLEGVFSLLFNSWCRWSQKMGYLLLLKRWCDIITKKQLVTKFYPLCPTWVMTELDKLHLTRVKGDEIERNLGVRLCR